MEYENRQSNKGNNRRKGKKFVEHDEHVDKNLKKKDDKNKKR